MRAEPQQGGCRVPAAFEGEEEREQDQRGENGFRRATRGDRENERIKEMQRRQEGGATRHIAFARCKGRVWDWCLLLRDSAREAG